MKIGRRQIRILGQSPYGDFDVILAQGDDDTPEIVMILSQLNDEEYEKRNVVVQAREVGEWENVSPVDASA